MDRECPFLIQTESHEAPIERHPHNTVAQIRKKFNSILHKIEKNECDLGQIGGSAVWGL